MTTHVIADPTTTPRRLTPKRHAAWLALSAAFTDEVPVIAGREDLIVTIAPGAGHGAPACFLPAHATIEVNGKHLGRTVKPATVMPHRVGDRARYATAWGLLTHECAHARHSVWRAPEDAPPGALAAATLLEESRIEAAQIRRRPDDRYWLRASATNLILADTHARDATRAPGMTGQDAAQSAALLLARADGGILTRAEVAPVTREITALLGASTLAELRTVWQTAHRLADDDTHGMVELGRRWCEILGTDPDAPPPAEPDGKPGGSSRPSQPTGPTGSGARSPLAKAITRSLSKVRRAVAAQAPPADPATRAEAARAAENTARQTARDAATQVFTGGGGPAGTTALAGTRPPTTAERRAARTLARAIDTAGVRDRIATTTPSAMPPGRLRMRGALAADAQRAAGALPTAQPFTRTTRRTLPTPPLRLGIACDVSGSMEDYAAPVASAAWILAHTARHTRVPVTTATVIFGHHVRPITHPGTAPNQVSEFDSNDNWEDIARAIDALDGALGLAQPDAARLLVIISDGHFRTGPRRDGQHRIHRLRATGVAVLWLAPNDETATPLHGATLHTLDDPTTTAQAIGRAATTALRATR